MAETSVIDGALMTIRTARSRHRCTGPYPGVHWIEPGEQYEDWRCPPWTDGNESPRWWRAKRHVGAGDGRVCDEIEAYRENAAREQRAAVEVVPCAGAPYRCDGFDPADWPGDIPDFTAFAFLNTADTSPGTGREDREGD